MHDWFVLNNEKLNLGKFHMVKSSLYEIQNWLLETQYD